MADFTRAVLRGVHAEVKSRCPKLNLRKDAWVWHFGHDSWEFHGPENFYWNGKAGDAYDARAKGWSAWLQAKCERES